jgi:hypothetical protein
MKHIPFDPDAPLILRPEIDPWPDRVEPGIYAFRMFRIHLFLENRTDIPVESPLILFPRLGLDIRPYPPMTIQPTMSGPRKLLSCTASSSLQIAPHASLKASAIMFSYDRSSGAFALTHNDSRRIGAAMGDCRISCATGAANFPLRRVELLVAAEALRAAIDSAFTLDGGELPPRPLEQSDETLLALSA